ncbi:MAG: purA [Chthonomonadaceae bacterium]|nr:purA [Chthonomonadaceae bacterium]
MANIVVVGAQWGDEAKGKIVDYLAAQSSMVVRYGGGNNAGHSVTVGTEVYKFHLIPAGILNPAITCVIADGVVIDPRVLLSEIEGLRERGVSFDNLKISASAHVILPYHRLLDELQETQRGENKIGTTGRGIGPAYVDKAARVGIRMGEFTDPARFGARLRAVLAEKNVLLTKVYGAEPLDADAILAEYTPFAEGLRPYVHDTAALVSKAATSGGGVIFEGAQGTLLDLDLGTYPFVTSSHPIAGGACIGTGVGPTQIDGVIGVAKSYTTRVGSGVFPTELLDSTGEYIRERGHEYGTTTGRPRRCGWLDTVILRYAVRVNGMSCLSLGHLDVLSGLDEVKICVAYRTDAGETLHDLPADLPFRTDCRPVYETLSGWKEDVTEVLSMKDLPANALKFIQRVQELAGIPIGTLSVGPAREQTILFDDVLKDVLKRTGQ